MQNTAVKGKPASPIDHKPRFCEDCKIRMRVDEELKCKQCASGRHISCGESYIYTNRRGKVKRKK